MVRNTHASSCSTPHLRRAEGCFRALFRESDAPPSSPMPSASIFGIACVRFFPTVGVCIHGDVATCFPRPSRRLGTRQPSLHLGPSLSNSGSSLWISGSILVSKETRFLSPLQRKGRERDERGT